MLADSQIAGDPTFEALMAALRKRSFAVLATADARGRPQAAGVVYAIAREGAAFYVMTRTHLQKARNVAENPNISLVVPLTRRVLGFLPPPTIQFQGSAEILPRDHAEGIETFASFLLGRVILREYAALERRGETRVCFLRIRPGPAMFAYAFRTPLWRLIGGGMQRGAARVEVPTEHRS